MPGDNDFEDSAAVAALSTPSASPVVKGLDEKALLKALDAFYDIDKGTVRDAIEAYLLALTPSIHEAIEAAPQSAYDRGRKDAYKCVKVIADEVRANARNPMEHAVANAIATAAQAILTEDQKP